MHGHLGTVFRLIHVRFCSFLTTKLHYLEAHCCKNTREFDKELTFLKLLRIVHSKVTQLSTPLIRCMLDIFQAFLRLLTDFFISTIVSGVWSGNTTITNCRQARGIVRKSHTTITRHQEDKQSKATSPLFPIEIIAQLQWTQSNVHI